MAAIVFGVIQFLTTPLRAQGAGYDDDNAEVLTRGPVHEAFATVVDYNPGRGLVTRQRPPDPIEELTPEEMPVGENVAWIPGYWSWDDEQSDYIWVSGTWRVPPPGREWVPGYWADSQGEYIWISGYWAEIEVRETTYLPPPPSSLERGPNIARPSLDYGWTPGCWVWERSDYVWRPGYWTRGRGDWVWIPSYYVWTPHGYIYIDGYWDYVVRRRGVVYAPVRFHSRTYARRGYSYSPRIVFNIGIFSDHLFLRPRWSHYYFGDYYAPRYESAGFFFTFSYHNSWRGYDPFYSHWRWENRRERDWENRYQASYRYRREHEIARPPGTWSAQVAVYSSRATTTQTRVIVAGTTTQLAATKTFSPKFRRVNEEERRTWADRGQQVRTSRDERRTLEGRAAGGTRSNPGALLEPARVDRPRSAIASRPVRELRREFTPPGVPKAPKPDPKVRSGAAARSERPAGAPTRVAPQPEAERPSQSRAQNAEQAQERRGTSDQNAQRQAAGSAARERNEAQTRERNEAQARGRNEVQARERNAAAQTRERNEVRAREQIEAQAPERRETQEREKRETAQKSREADVSQRDEAQTRARSEGAARELARKTQVQHEAKQKAAESQRNRELQAAERRAKESEARAKREAQTREKKAADERAKAAQAHAKAESNRRAKEASAQKGKESPKNERGNSTEEEKNSERKGKGNGRP